MKILSKILQAGLLLLLPLFAQAATDGTWTCATSHPASVTIDAGSDRWFLYIMSEERSTAPNGDLTTIGGQAASDELIFTSTATGGDTHFQYFLFDSSTIAAMSGTNVVGDNSASSHQCWVTITAADQTAFTAFKGTGDALGVNLVLTSTSVTGDLIVASGIKPTNAGNWVAWDTLTERVDTDVGSLIIGHASGNGGDNNTTISWDTTTTSSGVTLVFLDVAGGAPSFSVSPTVTATTNTTYTIGYTPSQTTTFYTVACSPGESAPSVAQLKLGDCGSGADGESSANEAVTGADTTQMTGIVFVRHDIYNVLSDGGGDSAIITLSDENRAADTSQTIVVLTSVSSTSVFALMSDNTGDTTAGSPIIVGMTDTADFLTGMLVDVSVGFAANPRLIIAVTDTTLTLDVDASSSQTNVTVSSDVYFSPTVATGDVIEHDDTNSEGDTVTWAVDGDFSYTDTCGGCLTTLDYSIQDVSAVSPEFTNPDTTSVDDMLYIFNTAPNCQDIGAQDQKLVLAHNQAMTAVDYSVLCSDIDLHTILYTGFTGTIPTGLSLSTAGVLSGTPSVEDESGVTLSFLATDVGGLADVIQDQEIFVAGTVTMYDAEAGDILASLAAELATFPWRLTPEQLVFFVCDRTEADGEVLSQTPTASTEVAPDVQIVVTVASAGLCLLLTRRTN